MIYIELMEIGCLAFMSAYQLILFFQIRRQQYLILSLICLTVLVRSMVLDNGSQLLYQIFPDWGFETFKKIEFVANYSNLALIPMFIQSIFQFYKLQKITNIFIGASCAWVLLVLAVDYSTFMKIDMLFQLALLSAFIYVFYMLYLAIKQKQTGATFVTIAVASSFVFVLMEMARTNPMLNFDIDGPNLINAGMVLFLFFLSVALSSIYAESFAQNARLTMELNDRVLERTKELSESNAVKERIIRIISHDLRAPLFNLQGLVSIALQDELPKDVLNKNFDAIGNGVKNTITMLDDLLAWAASSSKKGELMLFLEPVYLRELIASRMAGYVEMAKEKHISIVNEIAKDVVVQADQNVLKVILRNLVSNAVKFSNPNSTIQLSAWENEKSVYIAVIDEGIGIPEEMKSSIFEMDAKNNRTGTANEKSSGIGLGLVKDLIDYNEGTIIVKDNPSGQGTIFEIALPKWVDRTS